MVDEFIDKLHTLERDIMDAFVLDADMRKYLCEMKEENVAGESDEYISMAFDIAAMHFHTAIKFVPVVLLVEVSRKINQKFGHCKILSDGNSLYLQSSLPLKIWTIVPLSALSFAN